MKRSRSTAIGVLVPFALILSTGVAQAKVVRGTVVHRNARAHSFVVADRAGRLTAIHSSRYVRVGSVVVVSARGLRNGTDAARSIRVVGRRSQTRARGVVTHVDLAGGTFTLSGRGVSMLVSRTRRAHASSVNTLPVVGTTVSVAGQLDGRGDLEAETVTDTGTQASGIYIEGTVLAIDTVARTLTISAEDTAQSGQSITATVPASLELSTFTVGEEVELQATLQPDGTYLLQGSASDAGAQGANDQVDQQGTQTGDQGEESGSSDSSSGSTSGSSDSSSGSTSGSSDGSHATAPGSDG